METLSTNSRWVDFCGIHSVLGEAVNEHMAFPLRLLRADTLLLTGVTLYLSVALRTVPGTRTKLNQS